MDEQTDQVPAPPEGLSARSAGLWERVLDQYELSAAELELLAEACRSLDRADQLRAVVDLEGVTTTDRWGGKKLHPAHDGEQRARRDYASFMRQLGVRVPPPSPGRGPDPYSARRR